MTSHFGRLLSIASAPLFEGFQDDLPGSRVGAELGELLKARNGFFAFESALRVRASAPGPEGLAGWNAPGGWRSGYGDLAHGIYFFAEDVFGGQFGLVGNDVVSFDPETGDRSVVAGSLDEWAERTLADFEFLTGYPLGHEWQQRFGPLAHGKRLIPKMPFVLGGDFSVDNLYALDAALGMNLRGELATQLRDLPDGAEIEYRVVD
jgi:hypothetical protein